MQEEVEHKMVLVVEGVAKMTPRLFAKALKQALRLSKGTTKLGWKGVRLPFTVHEHNLNKERHGKMTVKQLSRQNRGGVMSQIEVEAAGIGKFVPIAKKYGIDFAIRKVKIPDKSNDAGSSARDAAEGAPEAGKYNFQIFFKGADKDTVNRAFDEYIAKYDPMHEKKHPGKDGKTQPQKQPKAKTQSKKRTRARARENRPSLLKRLAEKKREVEDQRRETQRAPQELSR